MPDEKERKIIRLEKEIEINKQNEERYKALMTNPDFYIINALRFLSNKDFEFLAHEILERSEIKNKIEAMKMCGNCENVGIDSNGDIYCKLKTWILKTWTETRLKDYCPDWQLEIK